MKLVTGIAILGWEYSAEIEAILYSVFYALSCRETRTLQGKVIRAIFYRRRMKGNWVYKCMSGWNEVEYTLHCSASNWTQL
jgi:hypothetical protein